MINLAKNDEFKFFKMMWETMGEKFDVLIDYKEKDVWINPLFHIMFVNGKINDYIKSKYWKQYEEIVVDYIQKYVKLHDKGYTELLNGISSAQNEKINKDEALKLILIQIFELIGDDKKKWQDLMKFEGNPYGRTDFMDAILRSDNKYFKCYEFILNYKLFNDKEMFKMMGIAKSKLEKDWQGRWRRARDDGFFEGAIGNRKRDNVLQVYKTIYRDKPALHGLVYKERFGLAKALQGGDRPSVKILDIVIDSPFFNDKVGACIFFVFILILTVFLCIYTGDI